MTPRRWLFTGITAVMVVFAMLMVVLLSEGIYVLLHFQQPSTGLTYKLMKSIYSSTPNADPDWPELVDVGQIRPYLSEMKENGVGIGNSPFQELVTEVARVNHVVDGCLQMKPNLSKTMSYMRSELFNPFNPLFYFYDSDRTLPGDLATFLDRYSFRKIRLTTNAHGERITIPAIETTDKILVIGDSMGMSAGVSDDETLASQLQARDSSHQYVNIGVSGADPTDILCALERAVTRYPNQIRGVIYPFSENDLAARKPLGRPEQFISALVQVNKEHGIKDFTLIYMPYIYNSIPDVTRIPGHVEYLRRRPFDEKKKLLALAKAAGFRAFDYTEITDAERSAQGSQFAAFALYVDHTHLSRLGIARLVERLSQHNQ